MDFCFAIRDYYFIHNLHTYALVAFSLIVKDSFIEAILRL